MIKKSIRNMLILNNNKKLINNLNKQFERIRHIKEFDEIDTHIQKDIKNPRS